jgi:hypothetical protein
MRVKGTKLDIKQGVGKENAKKKCRCNGLKQ